MNITVLSSPRRNFRPMHLLEDIAAGLPCDSTMEEVLGLLPEPCLRACARVPITTRSSGPLAARYVPQRLHLSLHIHES